MQALPVLYASYLASAACTLVKGAGGQLFHLPVVASETHGAAVESTEESYNIANNNII